MKILFVSNAPECNYDKEPIPWNILPYYFKKYGHAVSGIGKYNLHKLYFRYLRFKPDIIITSWVPAAFIPIFLKKIGLIKCPIVHRWEDYYEEMMTNYPRMLVRFMENYCAKNADYIVTVLKTRYDISKKLNKKVFLLPYGIIGGNEKTKINLNKLKTKKSNLKVIYSGSQEEWKRVDRIINAAKEVDCDLFLFGEINNSLQKMAEGHNSIHFMGFVDSKEVITILKQADILVNTADHDMCMKFLDYISAGKPILAYNKRSANLFRHLENAYLTDDFKGGLRELIKNKKLRKKLEKNIKKIKLYSWEEVSSIHLKLYKKIISGDKNLGEFENSYFHIKY